MKTFDMPPAQRLKVLKVTPRKETHGKELVQAISMKLEWWPEESAALNLLHPNLQDLLFWTPPEAAAQCELDGIPAIKKHRRVDTLVMPLKIEASFTGYQFTIEHGIDDSTALELYACALDKFEFEAKSGGAAPMRWSLASNKQVTPQLVGLLCGLEGSTVVATLTPPTVEEAIDGTTEAFQKDHPGAGGDGAQADLLDDGDDRADAATRAFLGIHGDDEGGPRDSDQDSGADGEGSDLDVGSEPNLDDLLGDAVQPRTELPRTVKYRSPHTGETWSGRGQQPRWIKAALAGGQRLEDFAVQTEAV